MSNKQEQILDNIVLSNLLAELKEVMVDDKKLYNELIYSFILSDRISELYDYLDLRSYMYKDIKITGLVSINVIIKHLINNDNYKNSYVNHLIHKIYLELASNIDIVIKYFL